MPPKTRDEDFDPEVEIDEKFWVCENCGLKN